MPILYDCLKYEQLLVWLFELLTGKLTACRPCYCTIKNIVTACIQTRDPEPAPASAPAHAHDHAPAPAHAPAAAPAAAADINDIINTTRIINVYILNNTIYY